MLFAKYLNAHIHIVLILGKSKLRESVSQALWEKQKHTTAAVAAKIMRIGIGALVTAPK